MWIGDFVRCHSVVKLLKARYPERPVDVLTTTLCAPLLDYMPGVRKGIVVRPAAQAAGPARAPRAGRPAGRRALRHRAGDAAHLEVGAGAVPRRHSGADRLRRRGPLRPAQRPALRREETAPHDRPLRRAGPAEGRALPADWPMPELDVPRAGGRGLARAAGLAGRRPAGGRLRARRGRPEQALAGRLFAELARQLTAEGIAVWVLGGPAETPLAAEIVAAAGPGRARPDRRPTCATRSWRSKRAGACVSERFRPRCMSRPPSARRPSASSARPAPGTGRRSIRSPPSSRR